MPDQPNSKRLPVTGCATPEGTNRFAARFSQLTAAGNYREHNALLLSSIGIGTYLGEPNQADDAAYSDAAIAAVQCGVNVLDTAINYRFQRSERAISAALERLFSSGVSRDEIFLCTKAGFLTPDGEMPADMNDYFYREYIAPGICRVEEIAAGCHCMAPRFLENQLERSLRNLGIACLDLFYLHNPETQLGEVPRDEFERRISAAFEKLESLVNAGKIRAYGMATWNGFRNEPRAADYLSLEKMMGMARKIGGENHYFRFVQLPLNLGMPEALIRANQPVGGRMMPMCDAAKQLGITLICSAPLLQGHLAGKIPAGIKQMLGFSNDLECALQFARSATGIATALVGMKQRAHVQQNLKVAAMPPAPAAQLRKIFAPVR